MKRKIVDSLKKWKGLSNRMPLIINGARQVGKTYTALTFGKEDYKNTVYFNLEDSTEVSNIFERDLNPERIIKELSAKSGQTILRGDTLIILDEIQACERALTSLKYFCENAPGYHIIAAGSLLGVAINREKYSFPVGKVNMITLYPLDFEEYLWAMDKGQMAELIRSSFDCNEPLSIHETAIDFYKSYMLTGGMPQAVLEYLREEDYNFVTAAQKNINDAYIADMAKYATPNETTKIMAAFNSVPAQLAKDNRKFQYKVIKSGARAYEYETPLDWLKASRVIIKCNKVKEGKMPLSEYSDSDSFKVYMTDIGLLCSKFGIHPNAILVDMPSFEGFKGALAENYVASALVTNGYTPYYWESQGKAEVDFVIQDREGNIIPIEVKSSDNVRSKSLNQYIAKYEPKYSIRVSAKNFGLENGIKSVPLYAVFCI
ncbi:ATP-binding protein [Herbivorax sp. ANBcel31]|uniref:ATP-binding protein n=1 Tax=Herbivorax sp. ANBcel31 TaxID=3069754 RepID=UPI0027AE49D5|nr:ATP-binding protein [Herbivorax sp. ANBcel31]MDQ2087351.1 ATP-binding protein [Herbivorax sp. ANBcel31]